MSKTVSAFVRDFTAFGVSEVSVKLSRLFVVIAVARVLDPAMIGIAAAALAVGDIVKSLTNIGVVQRIVAAPAAELDSYCERARRMIGAWCLILFALQLAAAAAVWLIWGQVDIAVLIVVLAGEYLFMPYGVVNAALLMRDGKIRFNAALGGSQMVLSNILSVILALIWPSALVLVLPRLLTAPIWAIAICRLRPWHRDRSIPPAPTGPFISFGWAVLGVEVVRTLRLQADKLLVGALMGVNALGMYFMAFNAGLSLATSFSIAFSNVLFSHLCTHHDRMEALREGVMMSLLMVTPVVIAQALLAHWYVPLLLGDKWADLSPIVSVLCIAAIPAMLWAAASSWFRAEGRPQYEFRISVWLTLALLLNTALLAPFGLYPLAWGYLIVSTVFMTGAAWPVLRAAWTPVPSRS